MILPDQDPPATGWRDPYLKVVLYRDDDPRCEITDRLGNVLLTATGTTPRAALKRMRSLIENLQVDQSAAT